MTTPRRPGPAGDLTRSAGDTALESAVASSRHTGGIITAIVSALALIFSAVSLYQSVIKQAELHLYLPETISYTRDPDGSFEVFIVPVTVTNSGARDGVISSMQLVVRNIATGAAKTLAASYFADQGYFSTKEDLSTNTKRPKSPFAPLSIPGRSAYSGTILFYANEYDKLRVVSGKGAYQLTVSARVSGTEHFGFLDRLWTTTIEPITLRFNLPGVSRYFRGRMLSGHTVRLFRQDAAKAPK